MKVVIIGAGVAGLSIALRLVQSGAEVTVVERAQPARGATWAAAGMIAPTAESAHGNRLETDFARLSADLWPDFASMIERMSGRDIGYKRDGALLVATTTSQMEEMAQRKSATLLDARDARLREPMLAQTIAGALWDSEEAQVDNRALGEALWIACERQSLRISQMECAVRVELVDGSLVVRTPFAGYHADKVVIAAGAWSGEIEIPGDVKLLSRPVKGEMIALTPPQGARRPQHVTWGQDVYLVPRGNRLLVGATVVEAGFDTATTQGAADWLKGQATSLMPPLSDWNIDEHWAGLRPGSPDDLPILGETRTPDLFVATGQYRNGILFAPAIADAVSRLVLGQDAPEIRAFSPARFAT